MDLFDDYEMSIISKLLEASAEENAKVLKPVQIREIMPIDKWLNNSYYIGRDGVRLYDFWKEELCDIFGPKRKGQVNEIILEGRFRVFKNRYPVLNLKRYS